MTIRLTSSSPIEDLRLLLSRCITRPEFSLDCCNPLIPKIPTYNGLTDKNLIGHFCKRNFKRHLRKMHLITKHNELIMEKEFIKVKGTKRVLNGSSIESTSFNTTSKMIHDILQRPSTTRFAYKTDGKKIISERKTEYHITSYTYLTH